MNIVTNFSSFFVVLRLTCVMMRPHIETQNETKILNALCCCKFHDKETINENSFFFQWHCCDVQSTRPFKQICLQFLFFFSFLVSSVANTMMCVCVFIFVYYFARMSHFSGIWTHKILINSSLPILFIFFVSKIKLLLLKQYLWRAQITSQTKNK